MNVDVRWKFYDADDGSGGADDSAKPPATPPTANLSKEAIESLAAAIRAGVQPVAAAAPQPDPDDAARRAAERAEAIRKQVNDAAATGDVAQAIDIAARAMMEGSRTAPKPIDDDPAYRALVKSARKLAAGDHPNEFKRWGAEIDAEISKLPPAARLDSDSYEEAVRRVKSAHIDEIIEAERAKLEEQIAARARGEDVSLPPTAGGSRGRRASGDDVDSIERTLTPEQRGVAESLGLSAKEYAQAVKDLGGQEVVTSDRGIYKTELAPLAPGARTVPPGRF